MIIRPLRGCLLASTVMVSFAFAAPAAAQTVLPPAETANTADATPDTPTEADAIVVTGSRIVSRNLDSASPLQVVDAAAIRSTGAANLQEVLLQNPVFGTPTVSRTNSNFSTSGAGLATVDLRNLGTARTLVLVDGRRFVSGSPNDQAVDFNSIPTTFIERVEILTGGASSIYGSDAVAGVVNIIYRKNFAGLEANAQYGVSQEGDSISKQLNLTVGANTGDNRGNVMAYVGYSKEGAVFTRDRSRSAIDQFSTGAGVTGDPADFFAVTRPFQSSFAPQGRFFGTGGATLGTFDANGQFIRGFSSNGTPTRAADGFNRSAFRTIAIPVERFLIATRASYEISPLVNVFLEGTFAKSHTQSVLEPFPVSTAGTNGIFQGSGGFFPIQQRQLDAAGNPTGAIINNPFVPAALLALAPDVDGDGLRDISFTRRLSDVDNRGNVADRTTYRIVAGLNGEITQNVRYDAYVNYGRTDDNQTGTGQVNLANFRSALVVTRDAAGNLVCADRQARAQGCVPANVFGANTLSPTAAAFVRADSNRQAFASQIQAGANVSASLFDPFGAGAVGVAVGAEYRKESSAAAFDALQQAGLNGGNAIPNTSGSFNVKEAYIEGRVPLLTNSFVKSLELRGAFRASKYSTIGTVYSWNYGGEFAPVQGITFRGVKARATRAPNVSELFQGASQTFPTGLQDPCEGITATTSSAVATNCRAATGVNANITANGGTFTLNQSDRQGVSGFDTGNPLLREEKADTLTLGVVIAPTQIDFLRNASLTIDYGRTKIKGAIVSTPRQFIIDQCYGAGDPAFCQFITRRPTFEGSNSPGSLQFINSGATNSGGVFSSGIDVTAAYNFRLSALRDARINLGITYTRVLKAYTIPTPGSDRDLLKGEVGASKDRFLLTAGFSLDRLEIQYRGNYIGKAYLDDQFLAAFDLPAYDPLGKVSAKFYSDLQVKMKFIPQFEAYVGANNLFNVSPPPLISGLPGNTTGAETDAGTYDAIGRRVYAGLRVRF